jgi:hypothetical protein
MREAFDGGRRSRLPHGGCTSEGWVGQSFIQYSHPHMYLKWDSSSSPGRWCTSTRLAGTKPSFRPLPKATNGGLPTLPPFRGYSARIRGGVADSISPSGFVSILTRATLHPAGLFWRADSGRAEHFRHTECGFLRFGRKSSVGAGVARKFTRVFRTMWSASVQQLWRAKSLTKLQRCELWSTRYAGRQK